MCLTYREMLVSLIGISGCILSGYIVGYVNFVLDFEYLFRNMRYFSKYSMWITTTSYKDQSAVLDTPCAISEEIMQFIPWIVLIIRNKPVH